MRTGLSSTAAALLWTGFAATLPAATAPAATAALAASAKAAINYLALRSLPDWSGSWGLDGDNFVALITGLFNNVRPEVMARAT